MNDEIQKVVGSEAYCHRCHVCGEESRVDYKVRFVDTAVSWEPDFYYVCKHCLESGRIVTLRKDDRR